MGMEPCDVGPFFEADENPRHHPAGIEPVAERDERAQRRAMEQSLMDFYTDLGDYVAALDAMAEPKPVPHVEAGETFARLIRRG